MSATATKEKPSVAAQPALPQAVEFSDLFAAISDGVVSLKELRQKASDILISRAWASGYIEFGRRTHSITGPLNKAGSQLIIESGVQWSGPKTVHGHKPFRELLAEESHLPVCAEYRLYNLIPKNDPAKSPLSEITQEQAHECIALQVRLTDLGLSKAGLLV